MLRGDVVLMNFPFATGARAQRFARQLSFNANLQTIAGF